MTDPRGPDRVAEAVRYALNKWPAGLLDYLLGKEKEREKSKAQQKKASAVEALLTEHPQAQKTVLTKTASTYTTASGDSTPATPSLLQAALGRRQSRQTDARGRISTLKQPLPPSPSAARRARHSSTRSMLLPPKQPPSTQQSSSRCRMWYCRIRLQREHMCPPRKELRLHATNAASAGRRSSPS